MSDDDEPRYREPAAVRTSGGSSVGLIIGGIAAIAIAGAVGYYLYTGYQKERDYLELVQAYKNCLDDQIETHGQTLEDAHAYCDPIYKPALDALNEDITHGWGFWISDILTKAGIILGIYVGYRLSYPAIKWAYDRWNLKHRGGGGGTQEAPLHDNYDNTNWTDEPEFEGHCTFSYGTPSYTHTGMPALWASVNAVPDWQKEMLAGYLGSQGVDDPLAKLNSAWGSMPVEEQMMIAGLIIAGTLLVCTVSLGTATPAMLPIAAAAIAMV